ncbi:Aspartic peptidase domain [Phytophthora cactorum]|nr:Aspartic peptidase domain [Phytophthora cactorum]
MAKGSTTVPATPSKSGGARNESSSPDVTAARLAAVSELSVSFEDEEEHGLDAQNDYDDSEDKTPAPEPGAATPETATLSSGLSGATKSLSRNLAAKLDDVAGPDPDYDDFNDGTEGSKPSVASAKRSALLNAPRPPINGDTPASKRVFDRVEALMKNDEWMQLFKPIPKRKAEWPAFAHELQYPVNSVSTSQVAEDSVSLLLALSRSCTPEMKEEASQGLRCDRHQRREATSSHTRCMDTEDEGSQGRCGGAQASRSGSGRRRLLLTLRRRPTAFAYEDRQAELTRQMREIVALNDSDPTARIEMASHRPLDRIKPFSGSRNKSENSMQWLRMFVFEMTGTHTEDDKWCIPFELSLRDGAIHWFRQLPKKTKRTEHLCDYLHRLNGFARNARLQFEKGGRDAKEHVQQFLVTCGDDNMADILYHTRVNDIHELEEIIEDILKGKERMAKRDGVTRHTRSRDSRRDEPHDRRRDDYRNTPRVTLADASLDDLLAELEGREATRSDEYNHYQSDDASSDGSLVDNDRHLAAANEGERRAAAEGTYARSDNRPPRRNIPDRERGFNQDRRGGERVFNQDRRGGERGFNQDRRCGDRSFGQDSRGRRDVNRDNRRPQYGPCACCGGMSHSAHYCNKHCMFCNQAREAGQCELFRNFQDLAKSVRIKGTKEELLPELKSVVQERHLNYAARQLRLATEIEKERSQVLGGGVEDVMECADVDGSISEDSFGRVSSATSHEPKGRSKMMRLNPGEKQGWWSAKKFDRRIRMRALMQGAVNDKRTRILLDSRANVSVITDTFAKKLRLRDVPDHGRRIDIQGINEGKVSTTRRAQVKITLGWEMVCEFEMWVMAHSAGVGVVLGTDFMIPAGIRLDLFHGAAQLPNEIRIPLVKTRNMLDSKEYGSHVNAGPSERLDIPGHEWREYRLSKRQVALETHILWLCWYHPVICREVTVMFDKIPRSTGIGKCWRMKVVEIASCFSMSVSSTNSGRQLSRHQ